MSAMSCFTKQTEGFKSITVIGPFLLAAQTSVLSDFVSVRKWEAGAKWGKGGEEGGAVGPTATPHCVVWRGDGVKTASGGDEGEGGLEGAQEEAGGRAWDGEGRTAEKGRWVPRGARAEGSGGSGALRRRWIREVVGPMQRVGLRGGSGGCGTICVSG